MRSRSWLRTAAGSTLNDLPDSPQSHRHIRQCCEPKGGLAAVLALAVAGAAAAGIAYGETPTYIFTDLGQEGDQSSEANAINADGVVVGSIMFYSGGTYRQRAFYYSDGVRIFDYDGSGSSTMRSEAAAINDAGCAVGWTQAADGAPIYLATWKAVETCPFDDSISYSSLGGSWTSGRGINAAHQVVGTSETDIGEYHAFSKTLGVTGMTDLGVLPGGSGSAPFAVNVDGVAVGQSSSATSLQTATRWEGGLPTELGAFPGSPAGTRSCAYAINDVASPQIVGWSNGSPAGGQQHACSWQGGTIVDLGTLPGGTMSEAFDVNDRGDVVGWARTADFYVHAVVWIDGQILDLNTAGGIPPGWVLAEARGINSTGQIVGRGVYGGADRAFLLTPILVFEDGFENGTTDGWTSASIGYSK